MHVQIYKLQTTQAHTHTASTQMTTTSLSLPFADCGHSHCLLRHSTEPQMRRRKLSCQSTVSSSSSRLKTFLKDTEGYHLSLNPQILWFPGGAPGSRDHTVVFPSQPWQTHIESRDKNISHPTLSSPLSNTAQTQHTHSILNTGRILNT